MAATAGEITSDCGGVGGANSGGHGGGSRVLHNFTLPPRLSWGARRLLRCSKSTPTSSSSISPPRPPKSAHSVRRDDDGDQTGVVGEKLPMDFRSEAEKTEAASPWNLRTRRAACNEEKRAVASPPRQEVAAVPQRRAKFAVALTRAEIEDDFIAMTGRRPPRKPKKRPRYVQKPMDTMFPGLWLSEINAEMYKVNENPEPPK